VLPIQPISFFRANEKLRTVRVGSGVSHGKDSGLRMFQGKVFISEFFSVNGFSSGSISPCEVAALKHKLGDDAVELTTLISESLLAGAEGAKVLRRLGHDIGEKHKLDTLDGLRRPDLNVHVNLRFRHLRIRSD